MARVVYIGAPGVSAAEFVRLARADFPDLDLFASDNRLEAIEHVGAAAVVIGHSMQFDEVLVARAPKLRWIQSLTTGIDAILRIAKLPGDVIITTTRGIHGPQMSELVFLQMLALARDFPRMLRNQHEGRWERWPQPLLWHKTAVIVGVGAIAEALALRCKAFEMKVYGVSSSTRVPTGFDGVFLRSQLRDAARVADFLVLVVPLSAETENLVNRDVLEAMKPSAFLINVARGGVLDEDALLECLRARQLAGAALDVFRRIERVTEPPARPLDDPLWSEDRVIITPQIGGMSDVYMEQAYPLVRDNLRHFLANRLDRLVNVASRS